MSIKQQWVINIASTIPDEFILIKFCVEKNEVKAFGCDQFCHLFLKEQKQ